VIIPRLLTALVIVLLVAFQSSAQTQTPGPQDIPQPVPGEISLAGSPKPDVTRFLYVRAAISPSPSPDGFQVAFVSDISGSLQLWIASQENGWPKQLTFNEDSVRSHQWSPTGEWIAYETDRGGDERPGFYLIRPDGLIERELLAPSREFRLFGGFSPDGSKIAYSTTSGGDSFDIHILDVERGRDQRIFEGRMGLQVASWRPDGQALLITEIRGEDAFDVYLLNIGTGELKAVFNPSERAYYGSFAWMPDGSGFFLVSDQDREFRGLAYYDVAKGILRYVEDLENDVEQVSMDRTGRYLLWTVNESGYSILHGKDLSTDSPLNVPPLPDGIIAAGSGFGEGCFGPGVGAFASNAPVVALSVCGIRVKSDVWLWDIENEETQRVTYSDTAGLDPSGFVVPEHLSFEARDGVNLYGLLYLPRIRSADGKPPVLLAVHGGPTMQARPKYTDWHQFLLTRGIAVFDLNFRGSTGYGKTFARLNDRRQRPNEVHDMADALDFLASDGRVDASRAAVAGESFGGYLTMAALTFLPERFRGGVAFVGISNWITALEGASPELKASDRLEYGDIDDLAEREFFRKISPITQIDNVRVPVMVLHGANDPRDPPAESDEFVRAIRKRGGTVEYLRFPDEGHSILKLSNRVIAYRRVVDYLERVLEVKN